MGCAVFHNGEVRDVFSSVGKPVPPPWTAGSLHHRPARIRAYDDALPEDVVAVTKPLPSIPPTEVDMTIFLKGM